jgi:hypothetical protein
MTSRPPKSLAQRSSSTVSGHRQRCRLSGCDRNHRRSSRQICPNLRRISSMPTVASFGKKVWPAWADKAGHTLEGVVEYLDTISPKQRYASLFYISDFSKYFPYFVTWILVKFSRITSELPISGKRRLTIRLRIAVREALGPLVPPALGSPRWPCRDWSRDGR